jgi:hypothetical protein
LGGRFELVLNPSPTVARLLFAKHPNAATKPSQAKMAGPPLKSQASRQAAPRKFTGHDRKSTDERTSADKRPDKPIIFKFRFTCVEIEQRPAEPKLRQLSLKKAPKMTNSTSDTRRRKTPDTGKSLTTDAVPNDDAFVSICSLLRSTSSSSSAAVPIDECGRNHTNQSSDLSVDFELVDGVLFHSIRISLSVAIGALRPNRRPVAKGRKRHRQRTHNFRFFGQLKSNYSFGRLSP